MADPTRPFTGERRRALLTECFALLAELEDLGVQYDRATGVTRQGLELRRAAGKRRLLDLYAEYEAGVPRLPLSRCPFCDAIAIHSLDNLGLDGLWWSYDTPIRPREGGLCTHFLVLDGAVNLGRPVERARMVVRTGPEKPFVVPRMLRDPSVRAVISAVKVGNHLGYPTFYFADPLPTRLPLVNTWGMQFYETNGRWNSSVETDRDYDFDLRRWIGAGKVYWIAPGDTALRLERDPVTAPYYNLPGRERIQSIYNGEVSPP